MAKQQQFITCTLMSVLGLFLGLLFCVADPVEFIEIVCRVIGVYLILIGVFSLISTKFQLYKTEKIAVLIYGLMFLIAGILLCFVLETVITIIAGIVLIVLPIYRIVVSHDKKSAFKKELLKLIIGLIVIICGVSTLTRIVLYVLGGLIIAASLLYFTFNLISFFKEKQKDRREREENDVIDV